LAEFAIWGYGLAAIAYLCFGGYFYAAWKGASTGGALLVAVLVSCAWAAVSCWAALAPGEHIVIAAQVLDAIRNGAWYLFILMLLRPLTRGMGGWVTGAAVLVCSAQLVSIGVLAIEGFADEPTQKISIAATLVAAVLGLVLVEQLYRGMPAESRWGLKPLCLGLAAVYMFELYVSSDAFLFGRTDGDMWSVRGVAHALVLPLIALSGARNPSWSLRMSLSREAVFHSTALAVAGLYLLTVASAGYYVRYFGGEWGRALQATLLFGALVLLAVFFFSGSQRARLRVFLNKHLFPYRYDYRNEWLRFTQALSSADGKLDLGQSVIQALCHLVESPGGCLWLRAQDGRYVLHAVLNQRLEGIVEPDGSSLVRFLESKEWVINLEEYRISPGVYQGLVLPDWLVQFPQAWLLIPLRSGSGLIGFVVLSAPRARFDIDWEVLDLLKTAQRQAASYLARMQSAEALIEARKFESFNRMSAFVVHDLKNLVAQLSLMMKNAERHRHNPAFQDDMLETVAHVEARMRSLMAQLQEKRSVDPPRFTDLVALVERVCRIRRSHRPAPLVEAMPEHEVLVSGHPERLERVIGHIVQNALEATPEDGKVSVCMQLESQRCVRLLIRDTGKGMSDAFIRERLARPFETTKASGMGIGVYETRQYIRELGGDVVFESEVGVGTLVTIELPRVLRTDGAVEEPGVVAQHG